MEKPTTKIALSNIAALEKLIDQAPVRSQSEVSKRKAIAILAPKLYELRHKGYSWLEVAAWLSGHGLEVSATALQRYLRAEDSSASRGKGQRPARASRGRPRDRQSETSSSAPASVRESTIAAAAASGPSAATLAAGMAPSGNPSRGRPERDTDSLPDFDFDNT